MAVVASTDATAAPPIRNLVTNGGFETGDFTGWTHSGDTGYSAVTTAVGAGIAEAYEGSYLAWLGPYTTGYLTQTLATQRNKTYRVTYYITAGYASSGDFITATAKDGTTSLGSLTDANNVFTNWQTRTFTFKAASASTTLKFSFANAADYWALDGVSVVIVHGKLPV